MPRLAGQANNKKKIKFSPLFIQETLKPYLIKKNLLNIAEHQNLEVFPKLTKKSNAISTMLNQYFPSGY